MKLLPVLQALYNAYDHRSGGWAPTDEPVLINAKKGTLTPLGALLLGLGKSVEQVTAIQEVMDRDFNEVDLLSCKIPEQEVHVFYMAIDPTVREQLRTGYEMTDSQLKELWLSQFDYGDLYQSTEVEFVSDEMLFMASVYQAVSLEVFGEASAPMPPTSTDAPERMVPPSAD